MLFCDQIFLRLAISTIFRLVLNGIPKYIKYFIYLSAELSIINGSTEINFTPSIKLIPSNFSYRKIAPDHEKVAQSLSTLENISKVFIEAFKKGVRKYMHILKYSIYAVMSIFLLKKTKKKENPKEFLYEPVDRSAGNP